MPLRILVVARWYPSHEVPGRGTFVADQVEALAGAGAQVAVICPEPAYAEGLDGADRSARIARIERWAAAIGQQLAFVAPVGRGAAGVPVLRIPAPLPAGGDATRDPVALAALEAAVLLPVGSALHAAWPFDVIHAHTGLPDGLAAGQLADALRVPVLTTEHDSSIPERLADPAASAAYRTLSGPGRRLVAVSRALAGRIEARLGADAGSIEAVPNVVPVDTFQIRPDGERDPRELLYVGARKESKGTGTLLQAFALLHRARPELRLRLVGREPTGAEASRLRALAADLRIDGVVRFDPATDRAGVAAAMARAALFVHPSPWETFGIVAAEALAMGLPVVATPSGGVEEILGPSGRFGAIAADHTPAALAAAIAGTLDRRTEFDPAALRAHVAGRHAPDVVARDLVARFEALGAVAHVDGVGWPTRLDPAGPCDARPGAPVVVVGFRRASAVARIPALPGTLAATLTVVTSAPLHPLTGQPAGEPAPGPGVGDWADIDVGRVFRDRLSALGEVPPRSRARWRTLRHPVAALRRRDLWARQPALFADARRRAVGEAIERASGSAVGAAAGSAAGVAMLLPLDIDDLEAIEPHLGDAAMLAPGTLGWLVDRWESTER